MKKILLVSLALVMFSGCSSTKIDDTGIEGPGPSAKKKDWVDIRANRDKEYLYIKSISVGTDRNYLEEVSIKSDVRTAIAGYIYTSAEEELNQGIVGTLGGSSGSYGKSIQNSLARGKYSDMLMVDDYWRKIGLSDDGKQKYEYMGWWQISLDEITKAKARAWNESFTPSKLSDMDQEAKLEIEQAKERFLRNNY